MLRIVEWYQDVWQTCILLIKVRYSLLLDVVVVLLSDTSLLSTVQIDLEALAQWAGTEFICGKVVGMTLPLADELSSSSQKLIQVEVTNCHKEAVTTIDIPFDVVSIDIGSTTRDFETVPGASAHCISTRPISDLIRKIELEEIKLKERLR